MILSYVIAGAFTLATAVVLDFYSAPTSTILPVQALVWMATYRLVQALLTPPHELNSLPDRESAELEAHV
jgi:hypothetical protein